MEAVEKEKERGEREPESGGEEKVIVVGEAVAL